jgi:hypothetical protein
MLLHLLTRVLTWKKAEKPAQTGTVKKITLAVESLEERVVASISYFSYPDGTWSYDTNSGAVRHLSAARPRVMSGNGGSNTLLYAGFSTGTWSYSYGANRWVRLNAAVPVALSNGSPTLFVSYNTGSWTGTWKYDGRWQKLSPAVAFQMAAIGPGTFHAAFGSGLYLYESYANRWTRETLPTGSTSLFKVAASGSSVVVSVNTGTYLQSYNTNGWKKLTTGVTTQVAMNDTNDFFASFSFGTYRYNNGTWTPIAGQAYRIGAGSAGYHAPVLVGSWTTGTFTWQPGKGWKQLNRGIASVIA